MTSAANAHPEEFHIRDWMLELSVGVMAVLLGTSVWMYTQLSTSKPVQERPRPVWLGVPKVMAQTSDGRMVNIKLNLRVNNQEALKELTPYAPAFVTLIQEAGTQVSHEELQDTQGIKHFSTILKSSMNDYLEEESVHAKVKDVVFDELTLMP